MSKYKLQQRLIATQNQSSRKINPPIQMTQSQTIKTYLYTELSKASFCYFLSLA